MIKLPSVDVNPQLQFANSSAKNLNKLYQFINQAFGINGNFNKEIVQYL